MPRRAGIEWGMNIAFTALTLISLVLMTFAAPSDALPAMTGGVTDAAVLLLKLTAIYAVWISVLKMAERAGRPVTRRLFRGESERSYDLISVNLASNMLGMGGAGTPAAIDAMASMCREEGKATDNMLMLLVINATSIQIIPTTVISLRAAAGSADAASIILPSLIATTCATATGMVLSRMAAKLRAKLAARKRR